MIKVSELIESCAREACNFSVENRTPLEVQDMMRDRLRALAAKYRGCIVAEASDVLLFKDDDGRNALVAADTHPDIVEMLQATPLYRAKEAK